jgi:hypothetical protein
LPAVSELLQQCEHDAACQGRAEHVRDVRAHSVMVQKIRSERFANSINPSQAQSTACAAMYPVTIFLRILSPRITLSLLWIAGH